MRERERIGEGAACLVGGRLRLRCRALCLLMVRSAASTRSSAASTDSTSSIRWRAAALSADKARSSAAVASGSGGTRSSPSAESGPEAIAGRPGGRAVSAHPEDRLARSDRRQRKAS